MSRSLVFAFALVLTPCCFAQVSANPSDTFLDDPAGQRGQSSPAYDPGTKKTQFVVAGDLTYHL